MKDFRIITLKESINYLKEAGYTIEICENRFIGFKEDEKEMFYIDACSNILEYFASYIIDYGVIWHALNIFMLISDNKYKSEEELCKAFYETIHSIDPELITTSSLDD